MKPNQNAEHQTHETIKTMREFAYRAPSPDSEPPERSDSSGAETAAAEGILTNGAEGILTNGAENQEDQPYQHIV